MGNPDLIKITASKLARIFLREYPDAWCTLNYKNGFELLISVILSAQCTDARVNLVTPALFAKYPDARSLASAQLEDVESLIHSCGFYRTKARHIISTAKLICSDFGGRIPGTMVGLISLPGVARKTANIILFHEFGKNEGIAVDTHCMRISYRLGLSSYRHNQNNTEKELMRIFQKEYWGMYTNWMVLHGRKYCTARKPNCAKCPLNKICKKRGVL